MKSDILSDILAKIPDRNMNLNARNTFLLKPQLMLKDLVQNEAYAGTSS